MLFFNDSKLYGGKKTSFSFNKPPTRAGYRFKGVRVEVGSYRHDFPGTKFTILGEHITGNIKMTMLWEREYPITFYKNNDEAPQVLDDLKGYEDNDLYFRGFGGIRGYSIPKRAGFKFRGVRVNVGGREEEHLGNDGFYIKNVQGPISINFLWDEECTVTVEDPYLSPILKDIKIYKITIFLLMDLVGCLKEL